MLSRYRYFRSYSDDSDPNMPELKRACDILEKGSMAKFTYELKPGLHHEFYVRRLRILYIVQCVSVGIRLYVHVLYKTITRDITPSQFCYGCSCTLNEAGRVLYWR